MEYQSIGEIIREYREKKSLTILELSHITKIRVKQLQYLEANNFTALPSRTYLIGFLKTLSKVLEFDLTLAMEILDRSHPKKERKLLVKASVHKDHFLDLVWHFWPWYKALGIIVVISLISIYSLLKIDKAIITQDKVTTRIPPASPVQNKKTQQIEIKKNEAKTEIISIELFAQNGDSWLAYKVDQEKIVKYVLKRGKTLALKGEKLRIVLGNPQALVLKKNGQIISNEKHMVFPESLSVIYKPPFFVFDEHSGSVITKRVHEENQKRMIE